MVTLFSVSYTLSLTVKFQEIRFELLSFVFHIVTFFSKLNLSTFIKHDSFTINYKAFNNFFLLDAILMIFISRTLFSNENHNSIPSCFVIFVCLYLIFDFTISDFAEIVNIFSNVVFIIKLKVLLEISVVSSS